MANKGSNALMCIDLTHEKDSRHHVKITMELTCDVLTAVREDDFHEDWNAPVNTAKIIVFYSKEEMSHRLGKTCWFIRASRSLQGPHGVSRREKIIAGS